MLLSLGNTKLSATVFCSTNVCTVNPTNDHIESVCEYCYIFTH